MKKVRKNNEEKKSCEKRVKNFAMHCTALCHENGKRQV
jgi:hypothetical protein